MNINIIDNKSNLYLRQFLFFVTKKYYLFDLKSCQFC